MKTIRGRGASGGMAEGVLFFYRRTAPAGEAVGRRDPDAEWRRFEAARAAAVSELRSLAARLRGEVGDEAAQVFEAHAMMALDTGYVEAARTRIYEGQMDAPAAARSAAQPFAAMLEGLDDPALRLRAADLRDVANRIAAAAAGARTDVISPDVPAIVAADELTPSEVARLDRKTVRGIVAEGGSPASHAAILARLMGIPAVVSVGALDPNDAGRPAMIDGDAGEVVVDPDAAALSRLSRRVQCAPTDSLKGLPNRTRDGVDVRVNVSLASPEDLPAALECDGIGLMRSEFLFMNRPDAPGEEEQLAVYRRAVKRMGGRPVVIRTLDIGADKRVDWLDPPDPAARGLRALRSRPDVVRAQLRALYRAGLDGELAILFPMIMNEADAREAIAHCAAARASLETEGVPFKKDVKIGAMIETPDAAEACGRIAPHFDFIAVGTNDLAQAALNVDRQSPDFDPAQPAVLKLVRRACDGARRRGVPVQICGALAENLSLTETLLACGANGFTVPPDAVPALRRRVRESDVEAARLRMKL